MNAEQSKQKMNKYLPSLNSKKIEDILNRGQIPILVGGTGLYIKATLYNYQFKEEITYDYSKCSNEELHISDFKGKARNH